MYPESAAFPPDAKSPPAKPTARPGLSAIDSAIYPARTGTISPIARPPTYLRKAESGVQVPKFPPPDVPYPMIVSTRNASAIKIPPPITNGSICDTPFIRCV